MRGSEAIDSDLRIVAMVRRSFACLGEPMPASTVLDELLDERNAARSMPG